MNDNKTGHERPDTRNAPGGNRQPDTTADPRKPMAVNPQPRRQDDDADPSRTDKPTDRGSLSTQPKK